MGYTVSSNCKMNLDSNTKQIELYKETKGVTECTIC